MRRKLCYGARAIKERGGSSYEDWYCYQPQLTEEEAAEWAKAMEERMAAKPVPKKKIVVSPSRGKYIYFSGRQGVRLTGKHGARMGILGRISPGCSLVSNYKID